MDRFFRVMVIIVSGFIFGREIGGVFTDIKGLQPAYSGLEKRLRARLWAVFGTFYLMLAVLLLSGCASPPADPAALDWRTDYRLVRIDYIGSYTDFATQHLCPADGKGVYTVFEDVVTHTRLWRCSPPRGKVGDVVGLYE